MISERHITTRISDAELAELLADAKRKGLTKSFWIASVVRKELRRLREANA